MADAVENTTKPPPPSQHGPSSADIFFCGADWNCSFIPSNCRNFTGFRTQLRPNAVMSIQVKSNDWHVCWNDIRLLLKWHISSLESSELTKILAKINCIVWGSFIYFIVKYTTWTDFWILFSLKWNDSLENYISLTERAWMKNVF